MFRFLVAVGCGVAIVVLVAQGDQRLDAADRDDPAKTTKIVLIGNQPDHPFGSHMYLHECGMLARCLEQSPGVKAVVSDRWPKDPAVLKDVDAIVFYSSPGAEHLLGGPHAKQAEALLANGVGLAAIHWGTGGLKDELGERYLKLLGGWFNSRFGGLDVTRTRLVRMQTEHPIYRGWEEFELRDEIYLKTKLMPDVTPLLKVTAKDGEQTVAWTYERPESHGGRSFGITLGHFHDNFEIDAFRRVLVNGILWTAHVEVPAGGAPVAVTAADLDLGPPPEKK